MSRDPSDIDPQNAPNHALDAPQIEADEVDTRDVWERRDDESDKAWYAFTLYRDLPVQDRQVVYAYDLYKGDDQYGSGTRTVPGYFKEWASKYKWRERAAALDADRQRMILAEQGSEELEAYRERQRQLSVVTTNTAIRILDKLNARLLTLEPEDIDPRMIPSYARAAAAVATAASDAEAAATGVTILLQEMDGRTG